MILSERTEQCDWMLSDVSLARYTSMGAGGTARYLFKPRNEEDLAECLSWLNDKGLQWKVMGNGTNLVFRETGYEGAVILMRSPKFREIVFHEGELMAGAAASVDMCIRACLDKGYSGLEGLWGIPGTVGGLAAMNAGSRGCSISQVLKYIVYRDRYGKKREASADEIPYGYRTSGGFFADKVLVKAVFSVLPADDIRRIRETIEAISRERALGMPGYPCSGSIFKNPLHDTAGRLIDEAGCKGMTRNGFKVWEGHANWIIHTGGGTADDLEALIKDIQTAVYSRSGVRLELELEIAGG